MAAKRDVGQALKTEVSRVLRGRVTEEEWLHLSVRGHVHSALDELKQLGALEFLGQAGPHQLPKDARPEIERLVHYIEYLRSERAWARKSSPPAPLQFVTATAGDRSPFSAISLTEQEEAQIEVWSALSAADASRTPDVLEFRETYLGRHQFPVRTGERDAHGRLLFPQRLHELAHQRCSGSHVLMPRQALRFLRSPLLACFAADVVVAWGVSILDHRAWWGDRSHPYPYQGQRILVRGPRGDLVERKLPSGWRQPQQGTLRAYIPRRDGYLDYPIHYARGSVLGELHAVARKLTEQYGWNESHAIWWLLAGAPIPLLDPFGVSVFVRNGQWMVRQVMPTWIPAARVAEVYDGSRVSTSKLHARSAKTLLAASFVLRHAEADGQVRLTWETLWSLWNEQCEKNNRVDMRYSRKGDFMQAYRRGLEAFGRIVGRPGG